MRSEAMFLYFTGVVTALLCVPTLLTLDILTIWCEVRAEVGSRVIFCALLRLIDWRLWKKWSCEKWRENGKKDNSSFSLSQ